MLLTSNSLETQRPIAGIADTNQIDELRTILGKQQSREVGYDEARDIGASLIEFYQVLADEAGYESKG